MHIIIYSPVPVPFYKLRQRRAHQEYLLESLGKKPEELIYVDDFVMLGSHLAKAVNTFIFLDSIITEILWH